MASTTARATLAQFTPFAISAAADDASIRAKYRPFLLSPDLEAKDWISQLELESVMGMVEEDMAKTGERLKVLVLYGSLRKR